MEWDVECGMRYSCRGGDQGEALRVETWSANLEAADKPAVFVSAEVEGEVVEVAAAAQAHGDDSIGTLDGYGSLDGFDVFLFNKREVGPDGLG